MPLDRSAALSLLLSLIAPSLAYSDNESVSWEMANMIRDEGFNHSQVMATLQHLSDNIGPRLTGSPAINTAHEWTRDRLAEWGLQNAHLESWGPFGRGWSSSRTAVHLIRPRELPLLALPLAWTPGTAGPVRGIAMKVKIESEEDFDDYRGKLEGKILLLDDGRELEPPEEVAFDRYSAEELEDLEAFKIPDAQAPKYRQRAQKRWKLRRALNEFLEEERAIAAVYISSRDGGALRLRGGGSRVPEESVGVPSLAMATEHYNWISRLLDDDQEVEIELEIDARFHDGDPMAYNTVAEIPGSDKADEIVLLGAHLDSWHAGTGSNDNAAGCAVVMEAARILQSLGVKPRRTIRVALWGGEEQGLLGSRAHVEKHYATRPTSDDPEEADYPAHLRSPGWPISTHPEHARFAAYFNLDNGSGKIRGIYTQGNAAVVPIFESWLAPFQDLGASTVTNRSTGGTDHLSFDRVGLPGFQFIQDGLDYFALTHHSNLDTFDHAQREDLMQASVVLASFAYHAAMRDRPLPRKPMPRQPPESDKPRSEDLN